MPTYGLTECLWYVYGRGMKLSPISRQNLIKRLRSLGWDGPYAGGKHQHMVKGPVQFTIPNPHGGSDMASTCSN